jgi:amino acid adenylation domain-containing protein
MELVHERVREVARARPASLAVAERVQSLTYGALDARANALAHRLRALGVGPGVRVGLCHERSAVSVVGALATLKASGAYVGLDPAYPDSRLENMLRDAAVPVLLTQRSMMQRLGSVCAEVIDLDVDPAPTDACREPPDDLATVDDAAYVIYTSGSTGEPKGVQVSHGNLVSLVDWHRRAFTVGPADRASALASPAFDASVWELWPSLTVGASLHIPESKTAAVPDLLRDWLVATGITISFVPTPLAEALLDLQWPADVALRLILTGGDLLHRRPAPGTPFALVNNYGVAEATVVSTSGLVAPDTGAGGVSSIGRPIAGTQLYVLDADGRPIRAGEAGELYIGGRGVAIGYLNRPGLTAERFRPDPFDSEPGARMYRTGDLVRFTPEGECQFLGRLDNQVQVRGQRVELDEVVAALTSHPAVGRCVVVAREKEPGNLQLVAYVVPSDRHVPGRQELRDHLSSRLPAYMVPTAFVVLEALPLTRNGKVDHEALPAPKRGVSEGGVIGATPTEAALAEIFAELLDIDGFDRHDNFFELGGHSLIGAQLIARIDEHFGVDVILLEIFDNPTLAEMAEIVDDAIVELVASLSDEEVEKRLSTLGSHE